MLTLEKDKSATPIVQIHKKSNRSQKPEATVYYTHNAEEGGMSRPPGVC